MEKRKPVIFFFFAFGLTWACWIAAIVLAETNGFQLPDRTGEVKVGGVVRWVREHNARDPDRWPGMGIQFLYESEEDRLRVEATVERLMKKHLGEVAVSKLINKP